MLMVQMPNKPITAPCGRRRPANSSVHVNTMSKCTRKLPQWPHPALCITRAYLVHLTLARRQASTIIAQWATVTIQGKQDGHPPDVGRRHIRMPMTGIRGENTRCLAPTSRCPHTLRGQTTNLTVSTCMSHSAWATHEARRAGAKWDAQRRKWYTWTGDRELIER